MEGFTPLEEYGLIGNLETCALVSAGGSIDWLPLPHVESPSVFAAILDTERGGSFAVRPTGSFESEQRYIERTNVLQTTFHTSGGTVVLTDFMPVPDSETNRKRARAIYRKVTCIEGSVEMTVEFDPRFDYARTSPSLETTEEGVIASGDDQRVILVPDTDLELENDTARGAFQLLPDRPHWFVLSYDELPKSRPNDGSRQLDRTVEHWQEWAHTCNESRCIFAGPWHDLVVRSELVLKLLTHDETGAICAAPTTSLPETIGGVRNWDYRFNWIRDAAFTMQALANLFKIDESRAYIDWFLEACHSETPDRMQPLYGLHGETELDEYVLDNLSGYRNSAPVRVGNKATEQRQIDIFGELVLAIYEASRHGLRLTEDDWKSIRSIVEYVCEVWTEKGTSIWEERSEPQHFVFSRVMCWVALDRGLELAEEYGLEAPRGRWRETRATIKREILDRGFSDELDSFVQAYDSTALDATALLIPIVGFLPADDPRVQRTTAAIRSHLLADDGLLRRYNGEDGLPGDEGAFVLCSFWLVDVLALCGRVEEAEELFVDLLELASPLGLLAEEFDPEESVQLGNFPQAYSHIGLINSALYLGEARGREPPGAEPMGAGEESDRET